MRFGSNRRADRTNRAVLTVLGLLLVAASAAGLIAALTADGDNTAVSSEQRQWLLDNGLLMAAVGVAAALVALVLALLWLAHQLRPVPEEHEVLVAATDHGSTVLRTDALTDVVEQELAELDGVTGATARVRANAPDTIDVLLDVDDVTAIGQISRQISTRVLRRARQATGDDDLKLAVECRPGRVSAPARVA